MTRDMMDMSRLRIFLDGIWASFEFCTNKIAIHFKRERGPVPRALLYGRATRPRWVARARGPLALSRRFRLAAPLATAATRGVKGALRNRLAGLLENMAPIV